MKNIMFFVLNMVLSLGITGIITQPLYAAQPPQTVVGRCFVGQEKAVTGLRRIQHASQITLNFSEGQTIALSSDAAGKGLTSSSIVELQAMPSGKRYSFTGVSSAIQTVDHLLVTGKENTITMTAGEEEGEVFWLIISSPCASAAATNPKATAVSLQAQGPILGHEEMIRGSTGTVEGASQPSVSETEQALKFATLIALTSALLLMRGVQMSLFLLIVAGLMLVGFGSVLTLFRFRQRIGEFLARTPAMLETGYNALAGSIARMTDGKPSAEK